MTTVTDRDIEQVVRRSACSSLVGSRKRWRRLRHWRPAILFLVSLAIGLTTWRFLSIYVFNPYLVPPPDRVASTAVPMVLSGEIFRHIGVSLVRLAIGFSLGTALAIVVGVLMGQLRIVNELLDPIIEVLRYVSPTAMIPIAVIWYGIGENSKYFLIFWGTFFFILLNTVAGVMRTPIVRQRAARCLGANSLQVFLLVTIPSAVPYIVIGMRVALASSFMSIIPAEMLAADSGLGYLLQTSGLLVQTDRIFVALATICLLGFCTDRIFRFIVDRTLFRYMAHVTTT